MFIPLEGDNIVCLANIIAIYRGTEGTEILRLDGTVEKTVFSPPTLKKRLIALREQSTVQGRSF
ncbi:MAG: hypothetical protein LLF78_04865 [Synergistaceae bacterium]|nr:hypothetical protein [Synergistaceae bacterium]